MRFVAALLLTSVAACAAHAPIEVPAPAQCTAAPLAAFAGRLASAEVGAEILAASGARTLRWVAKGMMVTMEYRGDRATVYLDAANRVERASCS